MPEVTHLLDTHTWYWLVTGNSRLLKFAKNPAPFVVTVISVWELGILDTKKRIVFQRPLNQWVEEALGAQNIVTLPLTPAIALASTRLPGGFHGDPADRILMATARTLGVPIVTADKRILEYSKRKHCRATKI